MRVHRLLTVTAGLCLVAAAPAAAATVSVRVGDDTTSRGNAVTTATVVVSDDRGAADDVSFTVAEAGPSRYSVAVTDVAGLTAGPGCAVVDSMTVTCAGATRFRGRVAADVKLGSGADRMAATVGPMHSLTVDGGPGSDTILGASGKDATYFDFSGSSGDDVLRAGTSTGRMTGGPGADHIDTGQSDVDLSYADSSAGVTLDLRRGTGSRGDARGDVLTGQILTLLGSRHDDDIHAGDGGSLIYGSAGNDVLVGGDGADFLNGGTGDNTLRGGPGNDSLGADAGRYGHPRNRMDGQAGNDDLTGALATDDLRGGAGRDRVMNVAGNDRVDVRDGGADRVSCRLPHARRARASIQVDRFDVVGPSCPKNAVRRTP